MNLLSAFDLQQFFIVYVVIKNTGHHKNSVLKVALTVIDTTGPASRITLDTLGRYPTMYMKNRLYY